MSLPHQQKHQQKREDCEESSHAEYPSRNPDLSDPWINEKWDGKPEGKPVNAQNGPTFARMLLEALHDIIDYNRNGKHRGESNQEGSKEPAPCNVSGTVAQLRIYQAQRASL